MSDNKQESAPAPLSPVELKRLKEKMRNTTWSREDVRRAIASIQKLRLFFPRD